MYWIAFVISIVLLANASSNTAESSLPSIVNVESQVNDQAGSNIPDSPDSLAFFTNLANRLVKRKGSGRGGGAISSGSSGNTGGTSPGKGPAKADTGTKGYGPHSRPNFGDTSRDPPPPYSEGKHAPPPPYSPGSYGQRGPTRTYWNGQYYPYGTYGYAGLFPFIGIAPIFLAGPFGFYGHYAAHNNDSVCANNFYVDPKTNETDESGTRYSNGTFVQLNWEDGTYNISTYQGGIYRNGTAIDGHPNVFVNGTFSTAPGEDSDKLWNYSTINPNVTANGTVLKESDSNFASPLTPFPLITQVLLGTIAVSLI